MSDPEATYRVLTDIAKALERIADALEKPESTQPAGELCPGCYARPGFSCAPGCTNARPGAALSPG